MFALIKRTLNVNKKSLFIYIIISIILMWMYVALFPSMQEQAETLSEAFASYPEGFMKAFGVDLDTLFLTIESFLAAEHYSLIWPLLVIILGISLGASAIAGEVDEGTMEILLAQPLSRLHIFWGKYIAGLTLLFVFSFVSVFSVIPFALLHNVDVQLANHLYVAIVGLLFGITIFSISMMLSSLFSARGRVVSIIAGLLIGMYALNLVASLKESLENFKYLSFFHYYDSNAAIIDSEIYFLSIAVFVGITVLCSIAGSMIFMKRDVAT